MNNETFQRCTHKDCGRYKFSDRDEWSCRAMRDDACAVINHPDLYLGPANPTPAEREGEREALIERLEYWLRDPEMPINSVYPDGLSDRQRDIKATVDFLRQAARSLPPEITGGQGHNKPCYYCGEPCNGFAGDPGLWPLAFCHRDEPGVMKWHHSRCVTRRLVENQPPEKGVVEAAQSLIAALDSKDEEAAHAVDRAVDRLRRALSYSPAPAVVGDGKDAVLPCDLRVTMEDGGHEGVTFCKGVKMATIQAAVQRWYRKAALAAAALSTPEAPAASDGDGWKLVPVEPTEEMEAAADEPFHAAFQAAAKRCKERGVQIALASGEFSPAIYRAMLQAAPSRERKKE